MGVATLYTSWRYRRDGGNFTFHVEVEMALLMWNMIDGVGKLNTFGNISAKLKVGLSIILAGM
jgi:hypothetical protein